MVGSTGSLSGFRVLKTVYNAVFIKVKEKNLEFVCVKSYLGLNLKKNASVGTRNW